ncbi:MAG: tRNA pseudouridine(38-40) synthase TruA [Pirellulales bacterium]
MPERYFKLTIAHDGTRYAGWQSQPGERTIQEELQKVLKRLTKQELNVQSSGRTDSGVHALAQIVSFHLDTDWEPDTFRRAMNAYLPQDIVVKKAEEASWGFHATDDTLKKRYRYVVQDGRIGDPFALRYAMFAKKNLDLKAMQEASKVMEGTHDFKCFEAVGSPRTSTIRTIYDVSVYRNENLEDSKIHIEVEADGFLYNMVRIIAGTLVEVGRHNRPSEWIHELIAGKDRIKAGMTAPAGGLYLQHVDYRAVPVAAEKAGLVEASSDTSNPV